MGGSDLGKLLCVLNLNLKEFGGFPYDSRRLDLKFKNEVRTYLNQGGQVGQELWGHQCLGVRESMDCKKLPHIRFCSCESATTAAIWSERFERHACQVVATHRSILLCHCYLRLTLVMLQSKVFQRYMKGGGEGNVSAGLLEKGPPERAGRRRNSRKEPSSREFKFSSFTPVLENCHHPVWCSLPKGRNTWRPCDKMNFAQIIIPESTYEPSYSSPLLLRTLGPTPSLPIPHPPASSSPTRKPCAWGGNQKVALKKLVDIHIPSMYGIFTIFYHTKSTKCRQIYHTWMVWDV